MIVKRSCGGCKAFQNEFECKCELGYKITQIKRNNGLIICNGRQYNESCLNNVSDNWKPLEECPKPLTYKKYVMLSKIP